MPDVHVGKGSTFGSVIPTLRAVIPVAVGLDIGCGMMTAKTSLSALAAIERAVPHGRTVGKRDKGARGDQPPPATAAAWATLAELFVHLTAKYPRLKNTNKRAHLGTSGTQNVVQAVRAVIPEPFETHVEAINCHHDHVSRETHFGENILVTRTGAVRARKGELGIIPCSMGARSFIVRGLAQRARDRAHIQGQGSRSTPS